MFEVGVWLNNVASRAKRGLFVLLGLLVQLTTADVLRAVSVGKDGGAVAEGIRLCEIFGTSARAVFKCEPHAETCEAVSRQSAAGKRHVPRGNESTERAVALCGSAPGRARLRADWRQ